MLVAEVQAATSIIEAVNSKKVKVTCEFRGLSNEGMKVTVKNISGARMSILIPAGLTFKPNSDKEQVLLNVEDREFVLNENSTESLWVNSYCTMLHKAAPSRKTKFTLSMVNRSDLKALVGYLKKNRLSISVYQSLIWSVSNHRSVTTVPSYVSADERARKYVAKLTNQPLLPYYFEGKTSYSEGGAISYRMSRFVGDIKVKKFYKEPVYMVVDDEKGKAKYLSGAVDLRYVGSNVYHVSFSVEGWSEGKYKIYIRTKKQHMLIETYEFEIPPTTTTIN